MADSEGEGKAVKRGQPGEGRVDAARLWSNDGGGSAVRLYGLRYAHLADRDIEAAAERGGAGLARVMALGNGESPVVGSCEPGER